MAKIKNWTKVQESTSGASVGARVTWENDKTGTHVEVSMVGGYYNDEETWRVSIPAYPPYYRSERLGDAGSKSGAVRKAKKWMRDNPEPKRFAIPGYPAFSDNGGWF